jgi:hypothetical protein
LSSQVKPFPQTASLEEWHAALVEASWDIRYGDIAKSIRRIDAALAARKTGKKTYDPEAWRAMKEASDFLEQFELVTGTKVKRVGNPVLVKCPLPDHKDGSPSFAIYRRNQSFHCFGCHKSGSMVDFLMAYEGLDLGKAMRKFEALCKQ